MMNLKVIAFVVIVLPAIPFLSRALAASSKMRDAALAGLVLCTAYQVDINLLYLGNRKLGDPGLEVTVTDVLAWSIMLALVTGFRGELRLPRWTGWVALFFALAAVSLALSAYAEIGVLTMWKYLRAYGIFWCTYNLLRVQKSAYPMLYGVMGAAAVVGVFALAELSGLVIVRRLASPAPQANELAVYGNLLLVLCLVGTFWSPIGRDRRVFLGCTAAVLMAVASTQFLVGLLGAVVVLLGWVPYSQGRRPMPGTREPSAWLLGTVLLGMLLLSAMIASRLTTHEEEPWESRIQVDLAAVYMATRYLFGVGPNGFGPHLAKVGEVDESTGYSNWEESGAATLCRNFYLLVAAENGVFGLMALFGLFASTVYTAWALGWVFRARETSLHQALMAGLFLAFLVLYVAAPTDYVLSHGPVQSLYCVYLGMAAYLADELARIEKAELTAES